jgi:NADP-dependent 3-hydroxy acid dehydrogenase YdfG
MSDQLRPGILAGRVAVVLGATGWIGRAICHDLTDAGADLVLVGRNGERLDELQRELAAGDRVLSAIADVTSQLQVDDARAAALTRFGHVDLLVVCSGVMTGSAFEDGIPADCAEMIDVNLRGLLHATQTFADEQLHAADRDLPSDIVLIGAVSTDQHTSHLTVFNAIAAANRQLARTLRHEYGPRGLRVHIVEPGFGVENSADRDVATSRAHERHASRDASTLKPEAIASVVTLAAALPRHANLAEVLLLPTDRG